MVVLLPLGYVRYKTRYEAEQISVSTSPDGDFELVIYSVGDPDFPFGAAHGRLVLKGKEKTVAYRSFEVANDGARFDERDLKTTWYIDRVEVVVSGSEQRDELVTLRFNGQTSSRRLTTRYRREDCLIPRCNFLIFWLIIYIRINRGISGALCILPAVSRNFFRYRSVWF